jgi:hypothetical protein
MRILPTAAVAIASLVIGCTANSPPHHDLTGEMQELRVLNCIQQFSIAYDDRRDQYRLLAKLFIIKGTRQDFDRMLTDEDPLFRVTALYCLAHTDPGAAGAYGPADSAGSSETNGMPV